MEANLHNGNPAKNRLFHARAGLLLGKFVAFLPRD
jgi:hypothetical protein